MAFFCVASFKRTYVDNSTEVEKQFFGANARHLGEAVIIKLEL